MAPLFLSPSAFLAQMIGQTEVDRREPSRERHAEGVRAYRRMMGEDLIVLGPAGAAGLVL